MTAAALPSVSGIVLAGGRSARFGRDKLAESIDGRPLLHLAAEAVATVATDVIDRRATGRRAAPCRTVFASSTMRRRSRGRSPAA